MTRMIFFNLPVKDLTASVDFFTALGFTFNPQFTDENATCMIINDHAFVMLLVEPFFKTFISKDLADTSKALEALTAVSADSRDDVDAFLSTALAGGATESRDAQDAGFMYSRAFADLDGHVWEVVWMDPSGIEG
jgi:uncharacterized protein